MENYNLELNLDEMGMLTAIVLSYAKKVENGFFDGLEEKDRQRTKESFAGLATKVSVANMEIIFDKDEAVDAELL